MLTKTKIIIVSIFILIIAILPTNFYPKNILESYQVTVVKINNENVFKSYIADTEAKKQLGLMHQKYLPQNQGMLFLFDQSQILNFWMKNTKINLDIIYIQDDKIVDIKHNLNPCRKDPCPSYSSSNKANKALEINGGLSKKLGIEIGQEIDLDI